MELILVKAVRNTRSGILGEGPLDRFVGVQTWWPCLNPRWAHGRMHHHPAQHHQNQPSQHPDGCQSDQQGFGVSTHASDFSEVAL